MVSQLFLTFLLNAVWQAALIVLVAVAAERLLRDTRPRFLYVLWATVLTISLAAPIATSIGSLWPAISDALSSPDIARTSIESVPLNFPQGTFAPAGEPVSPAPPVVVSTAVSIALLLTYGLFVVYRGANLYRRWLKTRTIAGNSFEAPVLPDDIRWASEWCAAGLGTLAYNIRFSAAVPVPVTIGDRRPLVILPEKFLCETDRDLLLTAIGHELVHIERRDYFFNLLFELVTLPLSFHPAILYARRRFVHLREVCCDEVVATHLMKADVYARSLLNIAGSAVSLNRLSPIITVGITDAKDLEVRIMSLIKRSEMSLRKKSILVTVAVVLLAVPLVIAAYISPVVKVDPPSAIPEAQPTAPAKDQKEKVVDEKVLVSERAGLERSLVEIKRALADPSLTDEQRQKYAAIERQLERKLEESELNTDEESLREKTERMSISAEKVRKEMLAREANISMKQAIEIALASHPGRLVEKGIDSGNAGPVYKLIIHEDGASDETYSVVVVSGTDGQILTVNNIRMIERKREKPD
jgi:beta-lactamase regulating signal transducer with metallopeptidase domain/uncharacterized membrane protein YkoI